MLLQNEQINQGKDSSNIGERRKEFPGWQLMNQTQISSLYWRGKARVEWEEISRGEKCNWGSIYVGSFEKNTESPVKVIYYFVLAWLKELTEVYNDGNNTICHIYVFLCIMPFDFLNYSEKIDSPVLFFLLFVIISPWKYAQRHWIITVIDNKTRSLV